MTDEKFIIVVDDMRVSQVRWGAPGKPLAVELSIFQARAFTEAQASSIKKYLSISPEYAQRRVLVVPQ